MIGFVTVIVLAVGVLLAFETNNSVPFTPHYTLHLEFTNAEELTRGAEVQMGGSLIGFVNSVSAVHGPGGRPVARVTVALDRDIAPLPRTSRFTITLKGTIGTKYLDVHLGRGRRSWPTGATVPVADTGATVDLDKVLGMFTAPTRAGVQETTDGLGAALAGRGGNLNAAIGAFGPLTRALAPVMANLAAPATDLRGFIGGLGALSSALVPVAGPQADLFRGLDTTFTALAATAPSLAATIADSPATLSTVSTDAPSIAAFTRRTARLLDILDPGLATLPASAPVLAGAVAAGNRTLAQTPPLDRRVTALAGTLARDSASPTVTAGLDRLTLTALHLRSPLAFLAPVQTGCDYLSTLLANLASTLSDQVGNGTVLRFVLVAIDDVTGGEAVPSQHPYLSTSTAGGIHHGPLHADVAPDTMSPGEPALCSAGNEQYTPTRAQIGTGGA